MKRILFIYLGWLLWALMSFAFIGTMFSALGMGLGAGIIAGIFGNAYFWISPLVQIYFERAKVEKPRSFSPNVIAFFAGSIVAVVVLFFF